MPPAVKRPFPSRAFLLVLAIGLLPRLWILNHDVLTLIQKTLPDDAFYYFVIAGNIAKGHGSTFDLLGPTNGYHPLWLALITPLFALFARETAVHAALIIAMLADIATAGLTYRVITRATDNQQAGLWAAAAFFWHPVLALMTLNGLETAVNLTAVVLVLDRLALWRRTPTRRTALTLGGAAGLAFLARTDNIFLLVGVGLIALSSGPSSLGRRLKQLLPAAAVAAALVAPWLLWNQVTFGRLTQISGVILPFLERQIFFATTGHPLGSPAALLHAVQQIGAALSFTVVWAFIGHPGGQFAAVLIGLALLILLTVLARRPAMRPVAWLDLGPLMGHGAALLLVHGGFRWVFREWYTPPLTWLILAIAALQMARHFSHQRPWRVATAALFVWLALAFPWLWQTGLYPGQGNLATLADAYSRQPAEIRVGDSDTGIVSYLADRPVVNLDGVVNNGVAVALMDGRLLDYLLANDIAFLHLQPRYTRERFLGPDFYPYFQPDGIYQRLLPNDVDRLAYRQLPLGGRLQIGVDWGWKYLGEGWDPVVRNGEGIWSVAESATLYFAVAEPLAAAYQISVRARGLHPEQRLVVHLDEGVLGQASLTTSPTTVTFDAPPGALDAAIHRLTLTVRPAGVSTESIVTGPERPLYGWFDYIDIRPQAP